MNKKNHRHFQTFFARLFCFSMEVKTATEKLIGLFGHDLSLSARYALALQTICPETKIQTIENLLAQTTSKLFRKNQNRVSKNKLVVILRVLEDDEDIDSDQVDMLYENLHAISNPETMKQAVSQYFPNNIWVQHILRNWFRTVPLVIADLRNPEEFCLIHANDGVVCSFVLEPFVPRADYYLGTTDCLSSARTLVRRLQSIPEETNEHKMNPDVLNRPNNTFAIDRILVSHWSSNRMHFLFA